MSERAKLTGRELIWLVRGLVLVMAGMLCCLVSVIVDRALPFVVLWNGHLLLLPVGALAIWFGTACLRGVRTPGAAWEAVTRRCFWAAMSAAFLSPFVYLWRNAPAHDYLACNVSLFLVSAAVLLCAACQLVRALAEFFDDRPLAVMARVCLGACCALLVLPLMMVFVGVLAHSHWEGVSFWTVCGLWLMKAPWWFQLTALTPAFLTFGLLWTAKAISLGRLAQSSDAPVARGKPSSIIGEGQGRRVGAGPNERSL
ncbi:MAG: hypothetical protein FJ388_19545 [Verrucomicrobia bacterium]|nr:hypothetical protein [Verrucomicrobiota bacterium]